MTLAETLISVWQQVLVQGQPAVELEGERFPVKPTRAKKLRSVAFVYGPHCIDGIEQNPETRSRWAALARQGQRVMQFSFEGSYVGNVCEGKLLAYPAWRSLGLPE